MTTHSKQRSLASAIGECVRAGDTIHFVFSHNRSHAAVWEVARQFRDQGSLRLVATGLLEYATVLCAAGAVGALESAFAGNTYPSPSPSKVLVRHFEQYADSDPHWTNLTMTLRLMAGALGWPFVPTASLAGSDLERGEGRARIRNPFGDGEAMLLAPLNPDVAFVHAALADTDGNAVVYGPDAEELWGALAARRVVVTAERVVSPEALRALGPRPGLPGHCVTAVVEAPYGAHPQAQFVWNEADGVAPYAEDYALRQELRSLSRDPAAMRAWVEEWVFGLDHAGYLERVGRERLAALHDMTPPAAEAVRADEVTVEECAAVVAMREAIAAAKSGSHDAFFAGIGLSHLAAWAAEACCREAGVPVELVAETGMYGFRPFKGDPYLFNYPNARSSLMHSSFLRMLGALAGPRAERVLVFLAAAQLDRRGSINSSRAANGQLIVGSGGANDLVNGGGDCIVVMPLRAGRLVDRLPFVTSPAHRLRGVATDRAWFAPTSPGGDLQIAAVMSDAGGERQAVREIRELCDWPVEVAADLRRIDPPSAAELAAVRAFDPGRILLS
ncbi:3-oxoacid CoA-transferase [Aromatoleum toluolicum]|uniref:3-oxoacid CoA-transferase n=1 Tax=Aromatoleum toluolicum TaxID=90060 RepID=A0ABX1NAM0_9RHOO|nr:CoA-transferase [Aromatoleum toluolicum]NMF96326.1 3-oxoacid CoA-transferase [Aromatoleum toluolicum]